MYNDWGLCVQVTSEITLQRFEVLCPYIFKKCKDSSHRKFSYLLMSLQTFMILLLCITKKYFKVVLVALSVQLQWMGEASKECQCLIQKWKIILNLIFTKAFWMICSQTGWFAHRASVHSTWSGAEYKKLTGTEDRPVNLNRFYFFRFIYGLCYAFIWTGQCRVDRKALVEERGERESAKDHELGFELGSPWAQLRCMSAH